MLTPEQIAEGWIEHDGGPCPVEPLSKPGVMFRIGNRYEPGVKIAAWWDWSHGLDGGFSDIIAYLPEPRHD